GRAAHTRRGKKGSEQRAEGARGAACVPRPAPLLSRLRSADHSTNRQATWATKGTTAHTGDRGSYPPEGGMRGPACRRLPCAAGVRGVAAMCAPRARAKNNLFRRNVHTLVLRRVEK